jgi:hypothetical protein
LAALKLKRPLRSRSNSLVDVPMLAFEFCLPLYWGSSPACATHRAPVILVDGPTTHADLIVLPVNTAMGPGELMTTKYLQDSLNECIRHDCLLNLFSVDLL